MNENWDNYVQEISKLVEGRESYQKRLGKISSEILYSLGLDALKQFAESVKETTGIKISFHTLRNYGWTYKQLEGLDIPEDISYIAMQALAGTGNAKVWLHKALKEGWSSQQLIREIRSAKGLPDKNKRKCPQCGFILNVKEKEKR